MGHASVAPPLQKEPGGAGHTNGGVEGEGEVDGEGEGEKDWQSGPRPTPAMPPAALKPVYVLSKSLHPTPPEIHHAKHAKSAKHATAQFPPVHPVDPGTT